MMGLTPDNLTKCLIPTFDAKPTRIIFDTFAAKTALPLDDLTQHDPRPMILANLTVLFLSADAHFYDARSRAVLRRLSVSHLHYGTWGDFVETIENPITEWIAVSTLESYETTKNHSEATDGIDDNGRPRSASGRSMSTDAGLDLQGDGDFSMVVPKKTSMLLTNQEKEKRAKKDRKKRIAMMTAAAVGGGAIIGLTTGLAAPVLGTPYLSHHLH
jgi:hypothetical protein